MEETKFKVGDRVRCTNDLGFGNDRGDKSNPPIGMHGTITGFDDDDDILIKWDASGNWYEWVYRDGHEIALIS